MKQTNHSNGGWKSGIRFFFLLYRMMKKDFILVILLNLAAGLLASATTLCWKRLLEDTVTAVEYHRFSVLLGAFIVFLSVTLIEKGVSWLSFRQMEVHFSLEVTQKLKECFLRNVAAVPYEAFEVPERLDQISRAAESTKEENAAEYLKRVLNVFSMLIVLLSVSITLGSFHPFLLITALLSVIPSFVIQRLFGEQFIRMRIMQTPLRRRLNYLWGILVSRDVNRDAHAYNHYQYLDTLWSDTFDEVSRQEWQMTEKQANHQLVSELIRIAGYIFGIGLAILLFTHGAITIAVLGTACIAYGTLQQNGQLFLQNGAYLFRQGVYLNDYIRLITEKKQNEAESEKTDDDGIVFHEVSYRYPGSEHPAVENLNLRIRPGMAIAIVGENGAGKTTFAKLLLGLLNPSAGSISLNKHVSSAAFQDFARYLYTLRENIILGDCYRKNDESEVQAVLEEMNLLETVEHHGGLDAQLGTVFGGKDLSGGEWQRLAIARALYRNAELYVFDEPTAAVDPLFEMEMIEHFLRARSNATRVVITHRIGSVRLADQVIVFKDGHIVQTGTHDELMMNREGEYCQLFQTQAKLYRDYKKHEE